MLKKTLFTISALFIAYILYVIGMYYYTTQSKTYIQNDTYKLKGHPDAVSISGKMFSWFGEIVSENHPYYEIKVYDDSAYLAIHGIYKIKPENARKIMTHDLAEFRSEYIMLKGFLENTDYPTLVLDKKLR